MDSKVGIDPDTESNKDVSENISESEELKLISLKYWSKVSPGSRVSSNLLSPELSVLSPSRIGLDLNPENLKYKIIYFHILNIEQEVFINTMT